MDLLMEENGSDGYKGVPRQNFTDNSKSNGKHVTTTNFAEGYETTN
jgi:hypothetical protein